MFLNIKGIQYFIQVDGFGEPLLLLHGFTGDSSTWLSFLPEWKKKYQVIVIDIIGHGKSDSPEEVDHYRMADVVSQVKEIVDKLKLDSFHLLGYSMGGRLALAYYMKYPETVITLILESASPGLQTAQERTERCIRDTQLGNDILVKGMEWFVHKWENIPLFASQKRLDEYKKNQIKKQRLTNSPIGLANSLKGMGTGSQLSYWRDLCKIKSRTLLLTGELDLKFVHIAKSMVEENNSLTHISVENTGHAIHVEKPDIFGTIVMEFLSESSSR